MAAIYGSRAHLLPTAMLREKFENARFIRLANAALGDQAGHELPRCDIEAEICGRTFFRSDADFDVGARRAEQPVDQRGNSLDLFPGLNVPYLHVPKLSHGYYLASWLDHVLPEIPPGIARTPPSQARGSRPDLSLVASRRGPSTALRHHA